MATERKPPSSQDPAALMERIVQTLESLRNPEAVAGMARYGINPDRTYGVSIPNLRKIAREAGKHHALAQMLWDSGIH